MSQEICSLINIFQYFQCNDDSISFFRVVINKLKLFKISLKKITSYIDKKKKKTHKYVKFYNFLSYFEVVV